jgi:hypothetical protein
MKDAPLTYYKEKYDHVRDLFDLSHTPSNRILHGREAISPGTGFADTHEHPILLAVR